MDSSPRTLAPSRSRLIYAAAIAVVIALGLLSRRFPQCFPAALGKSPGDALWALMIFLGVGCVFRQASTHAVALAALAFSFAIEFSQLYHAPWVDAIRATLPGRLILGSTFVPSDLLAYAVGIAAGAGAEIASRRAFLPRPGAGQG